MMNLKSIVYVSTAYGNCQLKEIEEKIYPTVIDQDFESYLNDLRMNYGDINLQIGHEALRNRPNPYTLSKSIAEWMIKERYSSLPVIICRPSIVANSFEEPIPGWCDSTAGVGGAIISTGLGISRFTIMDVKAKADIVPVDIVVNSLIVAGVYRASTLYNDEKNVINITMGNHSITWGKFLNGTIGYKDVVPSIKTVRPVSININPSRTFIDRMHLKTIKIFSHYLFACLFDLICLTIGHKPFMMNLMDRIHKGFYLLQPFSCNEWTFYNENIRYINELLPNNERSLFNTNVYSVEWEKYFYNIAIGCRRYLVKDPDSTIEIAKRRYNRIEIIYTVFILIIHSTLYWLLKSMMINILPYYIIDYIFILYIGYYLFRIRGNIIDEFQLLSKHFSKQFKLIN
ncbi:hypothetical protein BLA29_006587 [Euroglyphus maynei]|uniref:Fatty acyl-CoA reductase n=1 Tax=Euroglyphus maynei TaxID=6958 RepID=A0A1Y3B0Z8_EURMA|nr:hypothetical protein BLA29_006587 [Euroglyphus maynei]